VDRRVRGIHRPATAPPAEASVCTREIRRAAGKIAMISDCRSDAALREIRTETLSSRPIVISVIDASPDLN
jgi:hypothetical protein